MVYELAVLGFAHAFPDRGDLPLVERHKLPNGLRGQGCAAAFGRLGQPVQAFTGGGVEPRSHGFTHDGLLRTMYAFCGAGYSASTRRGNLSRRIIDNRVTMTLP